MRSSYRTTDAERTPHTGSPIMDKQTSNEHLIATLGNKQLTNPIRHHNNNNITTVLSNRSTHESSLNIRTAFSIRFLARSQSLESYAPPPVPLQSHYNCPTRATRVFNRILSYRRSEAHIASHIPMSVSPQEPEIDTMTPSSAS